MTWTQAAVRIKLKWYDFFDCVKVFSRGKRQNTIYCAALKITASIGHSTIFAQNEIPQQSLDGLSENLVQKFTYLTVGNDIGNHHHYQV